ncbi:methyl-accepting chemotaxis protein [Candidatus Magnetomoraceae bacterium gMMP-15]
MKKRTLKFKLICGGITMVVIPLVIIGIFSVHKAGDIIKELAKERNTKISMSLAQLIQEKLHDEVKLIEELSVGNTTIKTATKVAESGIENASHEIAELDIKFSNAIKKFRNDYETFYTTDIKGIIYADGDAGSKGVNLSDREYIKLAIQGQISVNDPVKSRIAGNLIIPICSPIYSKEGKIVGTISSGAIINSVFQKISNVKLGKTGYAFIVNKKGIMISHPDSSMILNYDVNQVPGINKAMIKAMTQDHGTATYNFKNIDKFSAFSKVELTDWVIFVTQDVDEFMEPADSLKYSILIISGCFLMAVLIILLYFSKNISKSIGDAVHILHKGAEEVSSASGSVASASHSMAEGASQQAASVEESSASLEEIESMAKQNEDHAYESNNMMQQANEIVSKANKSMKELKNSMEDISKSSEETSKIVKTIDEIAFQTNLLALNAAVEAARAGEAGSGFAVVADEVRNLALRAAEAAGNTATLIEGTVTKIHDGSELVIKTDEAFSEVADSSKKVAGLIGEIAASSKEQRLGIEELNKAINEMDRLSQQNASSSEELATASEQMNAQTEQMKFTVNQLEEIVGGESSKNSLKLSKSIPGVTKQSVSARKPALRPTKKQAGLASKREIQPHEVIPMDDEDFRDF